MSNQYLPQPVDPDHELLWYQDSRKLMQWGFLAFCALAGVLAVIGALFPDDATPAKTPPVTSRVPAVASGEFIAVEISHRITCEDGSVFHLLRGAYATEADAEATYCTPGSGSWVETPGLFSIQCSDGSNMEFVQNSSLPAARARFAEDCP